MSKIEWTEKTWNPVTGCTKISEGCQNCYAEKMHNRLRLIYQAKYQHPFEKIIFHKEELNKKFGKKPKMIFVNSMSDLFHLRIPNEFISEVLHSCAYSHNHIFQILTKRSIRLKHFEEYNALNGFDDSYPQNIWLGVSVELAKYKHRIDDLRQTSAKVKFISFEPLLGDVGELDLFGIDWVIVGGESGSGARPMHPDWVRNIRNQCISQGVKFFFKQWGEWASISQLQGAEQGRMRDGKCFKFPGGQCVYRVGKRLAGRELDGRTWNEYPERKEL